MWRRATTRKSASALNTLFGLSVSFLMGIGYVPAIYGLIESAAAHLLRFNGYKVPVSLQYSG